ISASETPKSRLDTRSFPPVSTPAPPPPPAAPLKPLKPLSNMSCCHLSGSCLGCNRRKRTHLRPGPPPPRPPPPAPPRPRPLPPRPPPLCCLFCLIMSSRDISILSVIMLPQ
uniref:Uncharacterized protein n=1 Tax=Neolamprologus brichardi TaxID=32507 RepID=A0A3Q4G7D2_NEOBR